MTDDGTLSVDVVVVGGGAAGVMAAVSAKEAGAEVVLVAGPPGATSLSSGAVDLAGEEPSAQSVGQGLRSFCENSPGHPLGRLGETVVRQLALHAEEILCGDGRLYARRTFDAPHLLAATTLGALRRTWLQQRSQGDLAELREVCVAIADLPSARNFGADAIAKSLAHSARSFGLDLETCLWTIPEVEGLDFGRPLLCARTLDEDESALSRLGAAVEASRPDRDPAMLLLPPIAGIEQTARVTEALSDAAGATVREALGGPGDAAGLRLERHLLGIAESHQIQIVHGRAVAASRAGSRVGDLTVEPRAADSRKLLRARSFVLATGGLAGGGLVLDGALAEPLLGLPLEIDGQPLEAPQNLFGHDPKTLFATHYDGSHPAARAGVATDDDLRVRGMDNLWVAGSLLAGSDPARDGSGLGTALLTGLRAGDLASGK